MRPVAGRIGAIDAGTRRANARQRLSVFRVLTHPVTRYAAWQATTAYQHIPALRSVLERVPETHFIKLSHFLRHAHWEATNNGAERGGRGFRHEEAAHFGLRIARSLADTLTAQAILQKERCTRPADRPHQRKTRGRLPALQEAA